MSDQKATTGPVSRAALMPGETISWLEYKNGDDFPYYRGWPTTISGPHWAIVLVAVATALLVLSFGLEYFSGDAVSFIPRILFVAIPLGALAFVTPKYWTAIFRRVGRKDVAWMFGFGILNLVVTMSVGAIVVRLFTTASNAATTAGRDPFGLFSFYAGTGIQLFGEELLTILPFLGVMHLCTQTFRYSRKASMLWALGVSSLIFALVHLPTYNWNLLQCLLTIGTARVVLSLAYIKTKNIWVSTGAHILNDWFLFSLPLLVAFVLPK